MEEPQEQSEISKLQLSEKEEEFIGQCWDGIQDSGKLSMDGLGTLCETLGITMDVIDLAITDLGSEDLTMDCDDFMLLMGRMLRSGALTLPQAGITGSGDDGVAAPTDAAADDAVQEPTDPNEISKIELTEREEDFIGQCWDGVKKSDRLDMEGLHALGDTLGIEGEVMNVAVTGLGSADCTMDRGEFMLLMGRLLRSGALKMPAEPDATEEEETAASAPAAKAKAGDSWMAAMAQGGEDDEAAKPAAQAGNMAWMASMAGDADGDEEGDEAKSAKPAAAQAGMAWMATMAVEGEDVDEEEEEETKPVPAKAGMAAWMASMSGDGEDVDEAEVPEPPPAKAGAAAWMASMTADDGEDVDEAEAAPAAPKSGAAAWMASMAPPAEDAPAKPAKAATGMAAMMAAMAAPEDEDN
mmetsp:Transcript_156057/g.379004  ORF Transcript_156057/g.379004 Transcript_156057/m.379004 type:complete len:412 (-) Transcript_156057:83-1318(-)